VLAEIGADASPRLLVMNKIDLLDDEDRRELALRHPEAALVSAETGRAGGAALADRCLDRPATHRGRVTRTL
jgi:GTP-binding protein HflX